MSLPHMTLLRVWQDFSIPAIKAHWNKSQEQQVVLLFMGENWHRGLFLSLILLLHSTLFDIVMVEAL